MDAFEHLSQFFKATKLPGFEEEGGGELISMTGVKSLQDSHQHQSVNLEGGERGLKE